MGDHPAASRQRDGQREPDVPQADDTDCALGSAHAGVMRYTPRRSCSVEYFAFMGRLMGIIDSLSIEEHDLLVSDDHAVLLSRATTTQGDRSITGNSVAVYHLSGDKISEVWIINEAQQDADEFLA